MKAEVQGLFGQHQPLSYEDELAMAEQYDQDRGYNLPLRERSKEARALAEGARLISWTPTALRRNA